MEIVRDALLEKIKSCIKVGRVVLASGKETDFYFDGRTVSLDQEGAILIAERVVEELKRRPSLRAIGGPTSGADPIVSSVGVIAKQQDIPLHLFYVRKESKAYGMQKRIEGPSLPAAAEVILIDDVLTSGGSLLKAVEAVREDTEAVPRVALVLVDREEGGRERLEEAGLEVIALFRKSDFSTLTKTA